MNFKALTAIKYLLPPDKDASSNHVRNWRWAIVITVLAVAVNASLGRGFIPRFSGYAYAEDVDLKIEQALKPVNDRLFAIETSQATQGTYLKRLVKSDIAEDIHADKILWCAATTSQEKQRLRARIDSLQEEYEEAAGVGKRATEPDCESS